MNAVPAARATICSGFSSRVLATRRMLLQTEKNRKQRNLGGSTHVLASRPNINCAKSGGYATLRNLLLPCPSSMRVGPAPLPAPLGLMIRRYSKVSTTAPPIGDQNCVKHASLT